MLEMHSGLFDFIRPGSSEHAPGSAPNPRGYGIICISDSRPAFAHVFIGPATIGFECRNSAGTTVVGVGYLGGGPPMWVRLARNGNDFAAYYSANGLVWNSLAALLIWAGYATPVEVALLLLPFQYLPSLGLAIIAAALVLM